MSIGGLTESVVRAATDATVAWAISAIKLKLRAPVVRLGRTLVAMFEEHKRDDRVIIPLLRTVNVLAEKGVIAVEDEVEEGGWVTRFWCDTLDSVRGEMSGTKDVKKLNAMLQVIIHALSDNRGMAGECRRKSLNLLSVLLGHRFPRVRKATAEQLYLRVLECGEGLATSTEDYDTAVEVLTSTIWDAEEDLKSIRAKRDQVCVCLGVSPPSAANARAPSEVEVEVAERRPRKADDLASYASLVKEVGY